MSALALMIFARAPVPGACKTRLIPALGAEGAGGAARAACGTCVAGRHRERRGPGFAVVRGRSVARVLPALRA